MPLNKQRRLQRILESLNFKYEVIDNYITVANVLISSRNELFIDKDNDYFGVGQSNFLEYIEKKVNGKNSKND